MIGSIFIQSHPPWRRASAAQRIIGGSLVFLLASGAPLAAQDRSAPAMMAPDLQALLMTWGPCEAACSYDLNDDGRVDAADLIILLNGTDAVRAAPGRPDVDPRLDPKSHVEEYRWNSGRQAGLAAGGAVVSSTRLQQPGAAWLRLEFADYDLGLGSFVVIRSELDGGVQRLDARSLPMWYDYSAIFNGDAVTIEVHAAPGDENVFVEFENVIVGHFHGGIPLKTLCDGDDDRVASGDDRVGRAVLTNGNRFCSYWLASNGAVVTAGHCVDFGAGDGTYDLVAGTLLEFNFPASLLDGTPVAANPADQYPVSQTNPQFDNTTVGQDWAVITVNPNANSGQRAHLAYGFFRTTREIPANGTTIRITGCGTDDGTQNRTLQTDTGTYEGESSSGARFWHGYRVDTTSGNSGSPIIWNSNGVSIGVHTNGGCSNPGGANAGISFEHTPLETALDDYPGAATLYVDAGMPALGPAESGNIFRPYNTVLEGVNALAAGNILSIVEGSYGETLTITKAMTITAPVGTVTIGN